MEFYETLVQKAEFGKEILQGFSLPQKKIPPKFFYDENGSRLFEKITKLPEYYLTRTDNKILRTYAGDISNRVGSKPILIEYGSGASLKTRILLNTLKQIQAYVPVDISKSFLLTSSKRLAKDYPDLRIISIYGDYTNGLKLPKELNQPLYQKVVFFPGSTIGNLEPTQATHLLKGIHHIIGNNGLLLIGVDLHKSKSILENAYNDASGITAQFNLNLLKRINRELDAQIDLDAFSHSAFYNEEEKRIEMHLVSQKNQTINIQDQKFSFKENETIHTENSYKYTLEGFASLAAQANLQRVTYYLDPQKLFSVQLFKTG